MSKPAITSRKTTRYYVRGRGFSSLFFAARNEARKRLTEWAGLQLVSEDTVEHLASEGERRHERWLLTYAALFPNCDIPFCRFCDTGHGDRKYRFCKESRDQWVRDETARIMTDFTGTAS